MDPAPLPRRWLRLLFHQRMSSTCCSSTSAWINLRQLRWAKREALAEYKNTKEYERKKPQRPQPTYESKPFRALVSPLPKGGRAPPPQHPPPPPLPQHETKNSYIRISVVNNSKSDRFSCKRSFLATSRKRHPRGKHQSFSKNRHTTAPHTRKTNVGQARAQVAFAQCTPQ